MESRLNLATIESDGAGTMTIALEGGRLTGYTADGTAHEISDQPADGYADGPVGISNALADIQAWYRGPSWGLVDLVDWRDLQSRAITSFANGALEHAATKAANRTPIYSFELDEHQLMILVTGRRGEEELGCIYTLDQDGELTCDTSSDGCYENHWESDESWPLPPDHMVEELRRIKAEDDDL